MKEFSMQMKLALAFVFLLSSGFAVDAAAQTNTAALAPAEPVRIAVIAFQVAVGQTNEGKRNFIDIQKKYEPKRQQLKALSDEIDGLTKQLQTQGGSLSDTERAKRARVIDDKKKQLDRSADDAKKDYQGEIQALYGHLAPKVYDVLASYAQQQHYTLILDMSDKQSPVLVANPGTDITKAIIEAYNLKSGVAAPAEQPIAAAPAPAATHSR
jgi:Skp family chaperone for outer membrane proteins